MEIKEQCRGIFSLRTQPPHVGYLLSPSREASMIPAKKFHTDDINLPRTQASFPISFAYTVFKNVNLNILHTALKNVSNTQNLMQMGPLSIEFFSVNRRHFSWGFRRHLMCGDCIPRLAGGIFDQYSLLTQTIILYGTCYNTWRHSRYFWSLIQFFRPLPSRLHCPHIVVIHTPICRLVF